MFLDTDRDPTFDEGLNFIWMDMIKRKLYSATFYSAKVFFSYEPYSFSQKRLFYEKKSNLWPELSRIPCSSDFFSMNSILSRQKRCQKKDGLGEFLHTEMEQL